MSAGCLEHCFRHSSGVGLVEDSVEVIAIKCEKSFVDLKLFLLGPDNEGYHLIEMCPACWGQQECRHVQ